MHPVRPARSVVGRARRQRGRSRHVVRLQRAPGVHVPRCDSGTLCAGASAACGPPAARQPRRRPSPRRAAYGRAATGPLVTSRVMASRTSSALARLLRPWQFAGGAADLHQVSRGGQAPGENRGQPRHQIGLRGPGRGRGVPAAEPPRAAAVARRCPAPRRMRYVRAARAACALSISSSGPDSAAVTSCRACSKAPACRLACAAARSLLGAPYRIDGKQHRLFYECRGGGRPSTRLRPAGRPLQVRGDLLIRAFRALSPVPGSSVGIGGRIGGLRQRQVHRLSFRQHRRPVGGRASAADAGTTPRY